MLSTDEQPTVSPTSSVAGTEVAAAASRVMRDQLYGRAAEVGQALTVLREAKRSGSGSVIVVTGELGIGKSAVLDAVTEQAGRMGFVVRSAQAERGQRGVPLAPLLLALRSTDVPLITAEELAALALLRDQQVWLWERIAAVLEERSREAPVVISIDDAQWLDSATRSALGVLSNRLTGSPVVWLLTIRSQAGASTEDVTSFGIASRHQIRLGPLPADAVAALANDRLGSASDARTCKLLSGAAGNASLAVDLLDGMRAERVAESVKNSHSGTDTDPTPLPAILVRGVLARLHTVLDQSGIQLLQAGAVLGQSFTLHGAALLLEETPRTLMICLQAAVRAGLVVDDGDRIVFRHDLVRQALYEDLPPSSRKVLHRTIAGNLRAAGRPSIEVAPHLLATACVGDSQAVSLLSEAAQSLVERSPSRAIEILDGAMRIVDSGGPQALLVGTQRVQALVRVGRTADALELGERLLVPQLRGDPAGRLLVAVAPAIWSERPAELLSQVEAALAADGLSEHTRARLLSCRALGMSRTGQKSAARAAGQEALTHAQSLGDAHAEATARWALAEAAMHEASHAEAVEHLRIRRHLQGYVSAQEILACVHLADFDDSENLLTRARREVDEGRSPEQESSLLAARAAHNLSAGDLGSTETDAVALLRASEQSGERAMRNLAGTFLSTIALLRGDVKLARRHLVGPRSTTGTPCDDVLLGYAEALIADAVNQHGAAAALLGSGALDRLSARHRWSRDWMVAAVRIGMRAGDMALAKEAAQFARDYAERNASSFIAAAWSDQAHSLLTEDVELLGRVVQRFEGMSSHPLVNAGVREDYGRMLLHSGQRVEAIASLETSWNGFRQVGATGPAGRVQRLLKASGGPRRRWTTAAPRASHGWAALTPAEETVARLIADGHTNRDAAAALVLSPHTISTHLRSVFSKLGVNSRVQLTRIVMEET